MLDGFFDKLANTLVRDNSFLADSVIGASVFYGCEKIFTQIHTSNGFFSLTGCMENAKLIQCNIITFRN